LKAIPQVRITQPVDANGVFAIFPAAIIPKLQDQQFFYVWNDKTDEVRLMCSFDTTKEDVLNFGKNLRNLLG